jgi:hypothetical protein
MLRREAVISSKSILVCAVIIPGVERSVTDSTPTGNFTPPSAKYAFASSAVITVGF